jgi:hypothetical protein
LAIDQAKAFDSVWHDFMRLCLEFFGVPENLIRILEVFTTNRTAAILLDDGSESEKFDLEIGNTQGNGPSPLQFNFCEQILFFKLELDPRLKSIYHAFESIPATLHANPLKNFVDTSRGNLTYESDRETNNLEGFADDGTIMVQASPVAITAVKEILSEFAIISGLKCNVEKSVLLPVGFENIPDYVYECGFPVVDKISVLGVTLTKDFQDLTDNFEKKLIQ